MKVCKRKPIYRKTISYFIITYEYVDGKGKHGFGEKNWAVIHPCNREASIDYGHVIQSIKEYFSEKVVVNNIQALQATKESVEELFKKEE